jgi:hypothetical protein
MSLIKIKAAMRQAGNVYPIQSLTMIKPADPQDKNSVPAILPDCVDCKHFYITHEQGLPYGCRKFGFKSVRKPVLEVWEASHQACLGFQPRQPKP